MIALALAAVALELVSVNSAEVQANGHSIRGDISRDGRFVAFDSLAKEPVAAGERRRA